MIIPSIHNLIAKLDSTFTKESSDTNFYQFLQMVALEIDATRRELQFTKTDNYFYQVRDDQLYSNLGLLLKINKQPFHTKRKNLTIPLKIIIEEVNSSAKITVEWNTELHCTSEIDYSTKSPYIQDPLSQLTEPINKSLLFNLKSNSGTKHVIAIQSIPFSSDLYFRVKSVNQVGELRQSQFVNLKIPPAPLLSPIVTTENPEFQSSLGATLQVPLDDDPYGMRQYRKILYGLLTSYLTGPNKKGIVAGLLPFYDYPIEVVENYLSIPNIYTTNAILPEDEHLVHSFQVNVILKNSDRDASRATNLGELNEQVIQVLEYIKPAHSLPLFQYVIPDHFFCPEDNPFGTKQKIIELEPTSGPCGEKVYINPVGIDIGATSYYQDLYGYKLYCEYSIRYFETGCQYPYFSPQHHHQHCYLDNRINGYYPNSNFCHEHEPHGHHHSHQLSYPGSIYPNYEITTHLNDSYDLLDRNYFYIQNGQRLIPCPFVGTQNVELLLEHRSDVVPTSILIEGDVLRSSTTFKEIPFAKKIAVQLTSGNGSKKINVTFNYPDQTKTNSKSKLNKTQLGQGCRQTTVTAVTFFLNTLPSECCSEQYIEDSVQIDTNFICVEAEVLQRSFSFKLNNSRLNGIHRLEPHTMDERCNTEISFDHCMMTNVKSRKLNDVDTVLSPKRHHCPTDIDIETAVCDSIHKNMIKLNYRKKHDCDNDSLLNCSKMCDPEGEFLRDSCVVVEEFKFNKGFMLNGAKQYNTGNNPFFNISMLNSTNGIVMTPISRTEIGNCKHQSEHTKHFESVCQQEKQCEHSIR